LQYVEAACCLDTMQPNVIDQWLLDFSMDPTTLNASSGKPTTMFPTDAHGHVSDGPLCWGAELMGTSDHCSEQIDTSLPHSTSHFKNKFCSECSKGMFVACSRVRALSTKLEAHFPNRKSVGFWNPAMDGTGCGYRILNNTINCVGTRLVVFRFTPSLDFDFPPLPVRPSCTLRRIGQSMASASAC
jgi:hypothetical protein